MSFYVPTIDKIRDDYLRDIALEIPDAVVGEGSDYYARGTVLSQVVAPIYANGRYLKNQAFPDTCDDTTRARFALLTGVAKLGAQAASGTATVAASFATTIADGTTLINQANRVRYKTVGVTTIPITLSAPMALVALAAGVSGDADTGTVLTFEATPPGVNPSASIVSMSGGAEAWDSIRHAAEIVKVMRSRPGAGNVAHFQALGDVINGIEQAFVYPALRGTGTMDVVITTSAASGTRVAGAALIAKVLGALQFGAYANDGTFLTGIPADVFANTVVSAATPQSVDLTIGFKASVQNPFAAWPPAGTGYMQPSSSSTWYKTEASSSLASFTVDYPVSGTVVAPQVGQAIALFFPSVGFAKATITSVVTGSGKWTLTVTAWSPAPTETAIVVGRAVMPWNAMLPQIAGPLVAPSLCLSGAVPDFFASLGPGEMTALTASDVTRRRRFPRPTDTSPLTGLVQWSTDITRRLDAGIVNATDATDVTVAASSSTPAAPAAAFIGTPPSILTLGIVTVIPIAL